MHLSDCTPAAGMENLHVELWKCILHNIPAVMFEDVGSCAEGYFVPVQQTFYAGRD